MAFTLVGPIDARNESTDKWSRVYVRSYLWLRLTIGGIGLLLPVALILFVDVFEGNNPATRGSFSAYYWTGARDIFVSALCVIGVFLIGYKFRAGIGTAARESRISTIAGVAAILVAWFPTARPAATPDGTVVALTPLQRGLSENSVSTIHYVSAIVFIAMLAYIVFHFAAAEGPATTRPAAEIATQRFTPRQWQIFHQVCGASIILAVGGFGLIKLTDGPDRYALFVVELISTVAFSASWFAKGSEWQILKLSNPESEPSKESSAP